ncbi:MAG: hypothetical protein ACPH27_00775 [Pseudomonadales bacterium]|jgi:hypothetical protein|nr:hypothetical protein [Oceanospirillaceae bacterium]|tara:strand:- start:2386 stop:2607 length:222 start_codon:yes stop_codon:yes gene_type:complete
MIDSIVAGIKKLTEAGIALIALAVVIQVIFGNTNIAFVGADVVGNILDIVSSLGAEGLVGLAAIAVIYAIFNR